MPKLCSSAPLTLAECRALALGQNQRLTSAGHKQQAAEAAYRAAQTDRLPKLDFSSTGYFVRGLRGTPLEAAGRYVRPSLEPAHLRRGPGPRPDCPLGPQRPGIGRRRAQHPPAAGG
ncbi:MAG: TolC family protein [Hymenobacter sp.]